MMLFLEEVRDRRGMMVRAMARMLRAVEKSHGEIVEAARVKRKRRRSRTEREVESILKGQGE